MSTNLDGLSKRFKKLNISENIMNVKTSGKMWMDLGDKEQIDELTFIRAVVEKLDASISGQNLNKPNTAKKDVVETCLENCYKAIPSVWNMKDDPIDLKYPSIFLFRSTWAILEDKNNDFAMSYKKRIRSAWMAPLDLQDNSNEPTVTIRSSACQLGDIIAKEIQNGTLYQNKDFLKLYKIMNKCEKVGFIAELHIKQNQELIWETLADILKLRKKLTDTFWRGIINEIFGYVTRV